MAKPQVTITLGRSGQKVVKDSSRDSNGVRRNALVLSGSKRPSSESFRSSDDRRFSNAKRMRVGVSARSYGYNSRLDDSKDLRLKLTRKRMSKHIELENEKRKKMELHEKKASRASPPSRRAAETQPVGSMIKNSYASWNSNAAKTRSPERIPKFSGGISNNPMNSIGQLPRVPPIRPIDASREEHLSMRDALESSRPNLPIVTTSRGFLDNGNMVTELPPATGGMSRPIYQGIQPLTVSSLLHALGLGKYFINFQAEEIDMVALKQMGDGDLKELGIPMGPRRKIILALEAWRKRPPIQQLQAQTNIPSRNLHLV
ncbi:hypothetical protein ABFS82_08G015500 [Erythranthe guttata]|uniref:protein bicaudal C homolog 1-B-like n=1 Tax=Erythranthe guttata TaxID=4155 RepID=UPI00064DCE5A|nr:PREDICTED: protein bicaudal C homolog 1-B-like [Erythranthe guttata]|eukprot:XP_012849141.1 PREDICTED: protein bicaudal C homolog 1-B-like [Erythranthe guttata]